ncbi:MAG: hypothetical protein ACYDBV_05445 [Nitrospiria bacterium]
MKKEHLFFIFLGISLLVTFGALSEARAGGMIKIDDDKWISVGAGLRTDFSSAQNAAPNGTDSSKNFTLDSMRLYTNGQIQKYIKFTFNTEIDPGNKSAVRVLDAIAQIEFSDYFNIWMGRLLPPSDRSNLDGPYYLNSFNFPFVQNYPALFDGRDNGLALWGQTGGGLFKYQVGAFQGRVGGPNVSDNLLYTGRLSVDFLDPEPGYYLSSSYYGAKDILALGLAGMSQDTGVGTAVAPGNFKGWSLDALLDKKLGDMGVLTVEGAYYNYGLGDVTDPAPGTLIQGKSYLLLVGYLIPQKIGIGNFQPYARLQSFDQDNIGVHKGTEAGVNYIIDGHNALLSLVYGHDDPGTPGSQTSNSLTFGIQLQI